MATQAHRPQTAQQHQQRQVAVIIVLLVTVLVVVLVGALLRMTSEVNLNSSAPSSRGAIVPAPTPLVSNFIGAVALESYLLINPSSGYSNCAAVERYIAQVGYEENRCYSSLVLPALETVITTPLALTAEQYTQVAARAERLVFMPSPSRRSGADSAFFRDGENVFVALWVAGDCTPRITDGRGGYWQMPVSPVFGAAENIPYGSGYLFTLPTNWQTDWRVNPSEAADWRLCAANTFWYSR